MQAILYRFECLHRCKKDFLQTGKIRPETPQCGPPLALGANIMSRDDAIIGASDHGGWAVLVTVSGDGTLLDRRRVGLVDEDLPKIPHPSEGQGLPLHT